MWMLKGILVGLGLFFIGTLVYLFFKTKPHEEHTATAVSALLAWRCWAWNQLGRDLASRAGDVFRLRLLPDADRPRCA